MRDHVDYQKMQICRLYFQPLCRPAGSEGLVILRILRHGPTRRALIVGCGLQMFQQLSGINTVMYVTHMLAPPPVLPPRGHPPRSPELLTWSSLSRYYSATILQMAGIRDDRQAIWLTAATSGCNFVFTLLGVWLVDRLGRRKLTLGSLFGTPVICCHGNVCN